MPQIIYENVSIPTLRMMGINMVWNTDVENLSTERVLAWHGFVTKMTINNQHPTGDIQVSINLYYGKYNFS